MITNHLLVQQQMITNPLMWMSQVRCCKSHNCSLLHFNRQGLSNSLVSTLPSASPAASSNEIRDSVKNEKLQKLIHSIDCSADPESELDKAMEEESFSQFAEKILSTIVPDA
ncbi:hypothetical protein SASPL_102866 [Salvia splendens]|uniref:Uncharacterized protein n=1 Tax=Salvia splendens TaxID=180675 RepID=A0A8X8YUL0_SALSN|nr:hypothetical protein SASPL_102866 [Salvia splendens]